VYETLNETGLGETFYRLKDVGESTGLACPAPTSVDPLILSELDSTAFQETHTKALDSGDRAAQLFLDGVHCAACVWLVERLPFEVPGVSHARLDLPRARLDISWNPELVTLSEVAVWLARVGYSPHPKRLESDTETSLAERQLLRRVGVSWALAGNVMLLAFALYAGLDRSGDTGLINGARWLSLALALPAVIYGGAEFFRKAWHSIRVSIRARSARHLHMDTPISLGILIGFGHSAWATVSGSGEVWFDSITVLIAALLTARWLQLRSRRFAGNATERLLALIPTMVRRVERDGTVSIVPGKELRKDDSVVVPPGEVIPVDGTVTVGQSTVNNAILTGESRPQDVEPGSRVSAGATNLTSPLHITVSAAGEDTRVGSLLSWIQDSSSQRAPVVLLANRLSAYFVVSVLFLAVLTAVLWLWWSPGDVVQHVVALLVITCPCALGMATPLAMAVAAGQAARSGIFIKTDEASQLLTDVDAIVLDKTGTLTEGSLSLIDWAGDENALDLAALLETHSAHPLGYAIANSRGIREDASGEVASFQSVAGQGVLGRVRGARVAVGRPDWIRFMSKSVDPSLVSSVDRFTAAGWTPIAIQVDGQVRAVAAFGDRLRDDAADIVSDFRRTGTAVYLISGDHSEVVGRVASELGIPIANAMGDVGPEEKRSFVDKLVLEDKKTVVMLGDGVNDAAALQAASVGIAVQGGSTASLVAADVFLTRSGLGTVEDLFAGARNVMRVIRRNLALSLIYNVAGATAAIAGLVTPLIAAVAMPVSSLVVVASSILQRSFKRPARTRR
jgi:Cu2+-exporting ATPase